MEYNSSPVVKEYSKNQKKPKIKRGTKRRGVDNTAKREKAKD